MLNERVLGAVLRVHVREYHELMFFGVGMVVGCVLHSQGAGQDNLCPFILNLFGPGLK